MWPLAGFAVGAIVGAVGAALRGPEIAQHARPAAKAVLKAALAAFHEAQIRQGEIIEAAEDLYAEASAEATAERLAARMAAARPNSGENRSTPARDEDQNRQAEIVAAVQALYAETGAEVTAEKLASVIVAAEAKGRAAGEGANSVRASRPFVEQTIDFSALRLSQANGSSNG